MKNDMYAIMKNGFLDITIGSWLHRSSTLTAVSD